MQVSAGSSAAWREYFLCLSKRPIRLNFQRLRRQGWTVLRFWAHDVEHDLDAVAAEIVSRVEEARKRRMDGRNGQATSDTLRRRC